MRRARLPLLLCVCLGCIGLAPQPSVCAGEVAANSGGGSGGGPDRGPAQRLIPVLLHAELSPPRIWHPPFLLDLAEDPAVHPDAGHPVAHPAPPAPRPAPHGPASRS